MFKNLKNKKGFTLIELIVVVAIIGILVALLVPSVNGYIEKAKIAVAQADVKAVDLAVTLATLDAEVNATPHFFGTSATAKTYYGVGLTRGKAVVTSPVGKVTSGALAFKDSADSSITGVKADAVKSYNLNTAAEISGAPTSFSTALTKNVGGVKVDEYLFFYSAA